jgi:hypothetical protein
MITLVAMLESKGGAPPASSPEAARATAVPTAEPTATPTAVRTREPARPTLRRTQRPGRTPQVRPRRQQHGEQDPSVLLAALRKRLDQQARSGRLDPRTATDINDRTREIDRGVGQGKTGEAADNLTQIRMELTEAAGRGTWSPDPAVTRLLDQLSAHL